MKGEFKMFQDAVKFEYDKRIHQRTFYSFVFQDAVKFEYDKSKS